VIEVVLLNSCDHIYSMEQSSRFLAITLCACLMDDLHSLSFALIPWMVLVLAMGRDCRF